MNSPLARVKEKDGAGARTYAAEARYGEGKLVWLRGTAGRVGRTIFLRGSVGRVGAAEEESTYFPAERLLPALLDRCGWCFSWERESAGMKGPVITISRSNNGLFFSGMNHNTLIEHKINTPFGAPLLIGCDLKISGGAARYRFDRCWRRECRFFIRQQADSIVSCWENNVQLHGASRWFELSNLKDASIIIFPEKGRAEDVKLVPDAVTPYAHCREVPLRRIRKNGWDYLQSEERISGNALIYW